MWEATCHTWGAFVFYIENVRKHQRPEQETGVQNSEVTDEDHYILKEDELDWIKYLSQCEIVRLVEEDLTAYSWC